MDGPLGLLPLLKSIWQPLGIYELKILCYHKNIFKSSSDDDDNTPDVISVLANCLKASVKDSILTLTSDNVPKVPKPDMNIKDRDERLRTWKGELHDLPPQTCNGLPDGIEFEIIVKDGLIFFEGEGSINGRTYSTKVQAFDPNHFSKRKNDKFLMGITNRIDGLKELWVKAPGSPQNNIQRIEFGTLNSEHSTFAKFEVKVKSSLRKRLFSFLEHP